MMEEASQSGQASSGELDAIGEMAAAHPDNQHFPIVGIGASAGGLEAATQFVSNLRSDSGMAYVLVQHLAPTHESQLANILGKSSPIPVREVQGSPVVRANEVYVIPPNTSMVLEHGTLKLSPRPVSAEPHLPIDLFFRSLAAELQDRAIGVILSGSGFDGTAGMGEIKAAGGITFAQDEQSAKYSSMPSHAADSGSVDFILPPDQIAARLMEIADHAYLHPAGESKRPVEPPGAQDSFWRILALLDTCTGVDFSEYRDQTLRRRIARRMALRRKNTFAEYAALLEVDREELNALYRDVLINVTSFFRDPEVFEGLKRLVFPELLKSKRPDEALRIWVPGCSTGQEAYSLAIALLEFLDESRGRPNIQIFATDISDPGSLDQARQGQYPETIESEVSPERLRRFFIRKDGGYRICKAIRDLCVFAKQNVGADTPFSHIDLISCRNLLIYLSATLQQRVIPTFHYALKPGGYLVLGNSESVGRFTDLFNVIDKSLRIYVKNPLVIRPTVPFLSAPRAPQPATLPTLAPPLHSPKVADLQKEADRLALQHYAPVGVLINQELEVVQFRGRTRAFLEPPPGEATFNVLRMARESVFVPLRSAIEEARAKGTPIRKEGIHVRDEDQLREVDLEVLPVRLPGAAETGFLIHFVDSANSAAAHAAHLQVAPPAEPGELQRLREELAGARSYLESIIAQQGAVNEDLQSANEEILSANEELQSTNEELQTAKEEAQSVNEELTTVNEELQNSNAELSRLNDDLHNLLGSVNIPIVMLGRDLCVRNFTPPAAKVFGLSQRDLGRPLDSRRLPKDFPDLKELAIHVGEALVPVEREVRDDEGRWRFLRMTPYRTSDNRIDGVTMVLVDIDEMRKAKDGLLRAASAKDQFIASLSHELRTPLTPAVIALAAITANPRLPGDLLEDLRVVERNIALEVHLIDDLLDVSRIVNGKLVLERQQTDAVEVLRHSATIVAGDLQSKEQTLEMNLPAEPLWIEGDPSRLNQVFWNLLRNASKFSPMGNRIEVQADATGGSARIAVRDHGIGIQSDKVEELFHPFVQAEAGKGFGGMGLGLAICKGVIDLHGGRIEVQSKGKNQGATFTVILPLLSIPVSESAAPAKAEPRVPARPAPLRILLVEDHADSGEMLRRLLKRTYGHTVVWVRDIQGALAEVKSAKTEFDVLLSDLSLPDGSGLELMQQLRAGGKKIIGIALSGFGMSEDVQASLDAGFNEHLTKPVKVENLKAALDRITGLATP